MRSALTILGLVVVLTIVLLSAKKQMQAMKHVAPATSASVSAPAPGAAASDALPDPAAVGRQVEDLMKQGERRAASEAD
ncbi:hypothetical protein CDN99_10280 [Roseateles aquatilis]|uniref:Uncharacterized protein n=1 Tax=Roseateles aquatilis TaxID=431061 RepID=A0A246JG77_9BURK|nr:hypothetical protein [Roseateles aquatilis]OWQ91521.1 hypothetical protein CDN99_10280 [Roseateles aquatilis]